MLKLLVVKNQRKENITSRQHLLLLDIKKGVPKENPNLPGQPLPKKSQPSTHLSSENLGSEPRNNLTVQPTAPSPSQHPGNKPKRSLPSQGNRHSSTLAHPALAQELEKIPIADNVAVYQCIDDIFVGRDEIEVEDAQQKIISNLESFDLQISPESKISENLMEKKRDMHVVTSFDQIKMPESTKELQQVLELLAFWRKHIPDFSIIARPLYSLLRKGKIWEWGDSHQEALKLLIFEATAHQALGPTYPTDPFQMEWGFAFSGLSVQQPVVLRGPFKVIKAVIPYSTPPPDGVAEGASLEAVKKSDNELGWQPRQTCLSH
ncbi:uncharacterized protein LOC134564891 [Prinia subflava]|uniref:uncharacterized protein LOC134564891 n=1 Tax=Prinia subflava TaxID=208062 RepID=UPI002FE2FD14